MCLAIPLQVSKIDGNLGVVCNSGLELEVALDLVEGVELGDWVIVHAGFAIQRLSPDEAQETLAILQRLEASWEG
ncbi:MAG: HypC/HybG/HupF family hydrogenase formation chaperone [Proteobacteria bacterium]|jgi:hydrogenase expression/formation protein HypC|nr:HypC/HybG/HupF family hydrogenase formation chaperone [Pseudomonadota bacterium]